MDQMDLFNYNMWDVLQDAERMMTEIDLQMWQWQTDLDMMSFIGQDIPMRMYVADVSTGPLTVKRVPLTKGWGEREIIGVADVNLDSSVARVHLNEAYKELIGIPSAFSIKDEDPPKWDHDEIKAQLKSLVSPTFYQNPFHDRPFCWQDHLVSGLTPPKADGLKKFAATLDLDNHPFFKDMIQAPMPDGEHIQKSYYPEQEQ